jgi:hypothetical protein
LLDLVLRQLLRLEGELPVAAHGQVRVKREILEDHRDVPLLRRHASHIPVADQYLSARDRGVTGDRAEHARFAAARGTDQDGQLSGLDRAAQVADDLLPVVGDLEIAKLDLAHVPRLSR